MPRIACLGRKWGFASDDLFYAGMLELMFNTAWLIAMLVVYICDVPSELAQCPLNDSLICYYIMIIASLSVSEFLVILEMVVSTRGTIMDEGPRRAVGPILIIRAIVRFVEFCFSVYAATFVFAPIFFEKYTMCTIVSPLSYNSARISAAVSLVMFGIFLGFLIFVYDPLGRARLNKDPQRFEERARKMYRKRMNCCLYLCGQVETNDVVDRNRLEAFSAVAEYLSEFFESDDLCASDVLAGLLLLGKQHRISGLTTVRHAPPDTPSSHSIQTDSVTQLRAVIDARGLVQWPGEMAPADRVRVSFELHLDACGKPHVTLDHDAATVHRGLDWLDVRVLKRVLQMATGIYGWPLYTIKHRPIELCRILSKARCCSCCCCCCQSGGSNGNEADTSDGDVEQGLMTQKVPKGDNCCECNLAVFMLETGLQREDILYASWVDSGLHRVAFGVVVDHALRSIVIVVRGTLSIGDVLTDIGFDLSHLVVPSESFEDFLDAPNHHPFFQPASVPLSEDNDDSDSDTSAQHQENKYHSAADNSTSSNEADADGRLNYLVHSGILHAAMRVRRRIETLGLLETAFKRYPTYNLVITGHSLGAGVAALLAWSYSATAHRNRLQRSAATSSKPVSALESALDRLVCYSFAPPGGLVSRNASLHFKRFVCSIYLGDDIVPRLGVAPMNLLKNELLVVLRDCKSPKYRVIASGCWQLCCTDAATRALEIEAENEVGAEISSHDYSTGRDTPLEGPSVSPTDVSLNRAGSVGENSLVSTRAGYLLDAARQVEANRRQLKVHQFPRMYAPGIIVQICSEYVTDQLGQRHRDFRISVRECDELQRILVSTSMIGHHFPHPLLDALGNLAQLLNQAESAGVLHRVEMDAEAQVASQV